MRRVTRTSSGSKLGHRADVPGPDDYVIVVWTCDDPSCAGHCISPWYRQLAVPKERMRKGARLVQPHPA